MAKARALDRRRKSIRSIRKITRTMELISTAQFKRAMDRATAATAYTRRITALVGHLAHSGLEVTHPLLAAAAGAEAGDAAGAVGQSRAVRRLQRQRRAAGRRPIPRTARRPCPRSALEVAGKRGISAFRFRKIHAGRDVHPFRGQAEFRRSRRAGQPLSCTISSPARSIGSTWSTRSSRAPAVSRRWSKRCCRWASLDGADEEDDARPSRSTSSCPRPRAFWTRSCRPVSRSKLFKCFLDAAVSEQIARMVAMKAATENADSMISQPVDGLQPRPARTDHRRVAGDYRRSGSAERVRNCKMQNENCKMQN